MSRRRTPPAGSASLPRGLRGLLGIAFLSVWRGTVSGYLVGMACLGLWLLCLVFDAPLPLKLFAVLIVLPGGLLVVPVAGVLATQRYPLDYRQLDLRTHLALWLRAARLPAWPLPAGALADPAIRRHAALIAARADRIGRLARGARATVAAELASALRAVTDADHASTTIDETVGQVERWERAAAGLPPLGAKLYLRHDPLSQRATRAGDAAAHLGVPSDKLNYFWHGQVLLLPPARSYQTLATLIDALLAADVADAGRPLPLQVTVQGALGDDAKLIALTQLLASGLDYAIEGPERRGDEGNLIARGKLAPEPVAGDPGRDRTDFLFGQIWATAPDLAAAGWADHHHADLRVTQTLAAALLASERPSAGRTRTEQRLAALWQEFAEGFIHLCAAWGVADAAEARYLDLPFAEVRPRVERLLARKAADPLLGTAARRQRDRTLALVELTLALERLPRGGRTQCVRLAWAGDDIASEYGPRGGFKRARRAVRSGARIALVTRVGRTIVIVLDRPATGHAGGEADVHPVDPTAR